MKLKNLIQFVMFVGSCVYASCLVFPILRQCSFEKFLVTHLET